MKCPGCGAEVPEGSQFCNSCGGKISGLAVDYSLSQERTSDVCDLDYDVDSSEPTVSESFDRRDELIVGATWAKFMIACFAVPFFGLLILMIGFQEKRFDTTFLGVLILGFGILAVALAIKFRK